MAINTSVFLESVALILRKRTKLNVSAARVIKKEGERKLFDVILMLIFAADFKR